MQTVSKANTNTKKKKKKKHGTRKKLQPCPQSTINLSHILITSHGFKVYRAKTLCRKNYCRILKHQENGFL